MQQIQVTRPEDLDNEAQITVQDVLSAHAAWLSDSPARYRHLLDATPVAPPAKLLTGG